MLLLGAYQETLGDLHNLFGAVHEVSVSVDAEGRTTTSDVVRGDTVREVLEYTGHEAEEIRKALAQQLARRREAGLISADEEHETLAAASLTLDDGTYLT
jgi:arginine decarboxylase